MLQRLFDVCEANKKLDELLDFVEHGEKVLITRHGTEVARLVPPKAPFNRSEAREAAKRIARRAEALHLADFASRM